jgi:pyrimidine-nucleoside phosphorylase
MRYHANELIAAKRDGQTLSPAAIAWFVDGYTTGRVPDYQMSAMCMAIYFRGMDDIETAALLEAMLRSGDEVRWDDAPWRGGPLPTADKHSTGGVGDKISIPLAPAVAACGVAVPMISGRGLGHTGGTLDKLESIPGPGVDGQGGGFQTRLGVDVLKQLTAELGVCLIGQTDRICPADKKMYALRDASGTVPSIPLITASIMSKKLAEGVASLVLDVKVGSGAFMKTPEDARTLARALVGAGTEAGRKVTAFLSAMDRPLGTHVGNALEVAESIELLRGAGPADSRAVVCRLGGEMLRLSGRADSLQDGEARIGRALDDGSALQVFRRVVQAQGGDPRVCDAPLEVLPSAPVTRTVKAERDGVLSRCDALAVGLAAVHLGAGRQRAEDSIDPAVGFVFARQVGEEVTAGAPLVTIHAANDEDAAHAEQELRAAMTISDADTPSARLPLWIDEVHGADTSRGAT